MSYMGITHAIHFSEEIVLAAQFITDLSIWAWLEEARNG